MTLALPRSLDLLPPVVRTLRPAAVLGCVSLLAMAGTGAAQGPVDPGHFAAAEANWGVNGGFGDSIPTRVLQVHAGMQGRAMTIQQLALRRDGGDPHSRSSFQAVLDLHLSTAATTPGTVDPIFDRNHTTATKKRVCDKKLVSFPATEAGPLPHPFRYVVPFDHPFVFDGAGPLCWDALIVSTNCPVHVLDAVSGGAANPIPAIQAFGVGCTTSTKQWPMALHGASGGGWPNLTLSWTGYEMPSFVTLVLGAERLPGPFVLPGSEQAPSGRCEILVNPLVLLPQLTQNGVMQLQVPFAFGPATNGGNFFAQVAALDQPANAWGLVTSNAVQHNIVGSYSASLVSMVIASNPFASTGNVVADTGMVVRF